MKECYLAKVAKEVGRGENAEKTKQGLNSRYFRFAGMNLLAIEQNPKSANGWAKLARAGRKVILVFNLRTHKKIAVFVDGQARFCKFCDAPANKEAVKKERKEATTSTKTGIDQANDDLSEVA